MQTSCKVWALCPGVFETLARRIEAVGEVAAMREQAELWAVRQAAATARAATKGGVVAVIPVVGGITQRSSWWGTSTEGLVASLRQAEADKGIQASVLDFDSPGGEVYGVPEAAAAIRDMRSRKPIVAVANSLAGSAAYYLASQADELLVTPSGEVGSIGVFGMHLDLSEAAKQRGLKVTFVYAGRYKVEGNPFEPLSNEAREAMQEMVDRYYEMFVRDVARGRKVGVDAVRGGFGEGRLIGAKAAVEMGMADAVGTLEDAIRRAAALGRARNQGKTALAAARTTRQVLAAEEGFVVQTLIFPKSKWDSLEECKKWAKDHGYKYGDVDETEDSWRMRQREPSEFRRLRIICINPGMDTPMDDCRVKAVGGPLKE